MTKLNVPHMRKNELGYPVVSDEIHRKLFGTVPRPEPTQKQLDRAISLLEKFKIPCLSATPKACTTGHCRSQTSRV